MRAALTAVLALLLTGCAALPPEPPAPDRWLAWAEHQAQASALAGWQLRGRIAASTPDEGWNASLWWRQDAAAYLIDLRGPFGRGAVRLAGGEDGVTLQADGESVFAYTPEQLLYEQTGWWLPVSGLRYWVLGIPDPADASRYDVDAQGRLAQLEQSGWQVRFQNYTAVAGLQVPNRLELTGQGLRVRLVVDRWSLPEPASAAPTADEALIDSALPAAPGCVAVLDGRNPVSAQQGDEPRFSLCLV